MLNKLEFYRNLNGRPAVINSMKNRHRAALLPAYCPNPNQKPKIRGMEALRLVTQLCFAPKTEDRTFIFIPEKPQQPLSWFRLLFTLSTLYEYDGISSAEKPFSQSCGVGELATLNSLCMQNHLLLMQFMQTFVPLLFPSGTLALRLPDMLFHLKALKVGGSGGGGGTGRHRCFLQGRQRKYYRNIA